MRRNARLARAAAAATAAAADRPGGEAEDGFEDGFEDDYDDDLWRLPAAERGGAAPARRYRDSP